MIITKKCGSLQNIAVNNRKVDTLQLEWFETGKRILHKKTTGGRQLVLKFLKENPDHQQNDIVFEDEECVIVTDILPCEVIVIAPGSMYEMARVCYETGNKHLPLFYENELLLVPYDEPLFRWLSANGFQSSKQTRKLLSQLKTSVVAHAHESNSLLSKILNLTNG